MPLDAQRARQYLKDFNFRSLFVEELGWERHAATHSVTVDGNTYRLDTVAHKRGLAVFVCQPGATGQIPDYPIRRKIDRQVAKIAHEHVVVFVDTGKTIQVWQWVKKEPGKPVACREHTFFRTQPGDALIQKLQALNVSIDEEATLTLPEITGRVRAAFDVERVTKRFYDRFKSEHEEFLKFLKGIPDDDMQRWYVSVMLNRLMFIYFIQKKGFLGNNDSNYLRNKLAETKRRGKDLFYREFLCPLFFEGFAKKAADRSAAANTLLGKVPYLNGGLFLRHQIEERYGNAIQIGDVAFDKLFAFFEQYHWHLDERPLKRDDEINPDVLGYIFEKYVNQKQMGAYYSKEDITGYISQNTVIPFLFDQAHKGCKIAFEGEHSIWLLLQADSDRYFYEPIRKGVSLKLPPEIAAGLNAVSKRPEWNKLAPDEYALPTEIWREAVMRRQHYEEVRSKLAAGQVRSINDLITYNLDIRQFAQDVIETSEGPELVRAFYKAIKTVSVLDPACGSGAFLFAALSILEPLYEACLERMQVFLDELEQSKEKHRPEKFADFKAELELVGAHPNRKYFVYKTIIVNNLFGVDIMEEATEICKLRLFLKLVAQIERTDQIEPLPDIDFNIRAGNSLVGYASYDHVKRVVTSKLDFEKTMERIEEKAQEIDRLFKLFREMQSDQRMEAHEFNDAKHELLQRLRTLEEELNRYLAGEYGIKASDRPSYDKWLDSHKPFHWFIEFYGIVKDGGFSIVIGNPPWREYSVAKKEYTVRGYATETCGNLHGIFSERALSLRSPDGDMSFIVQLPLTNSSRMSPVRTLLREKSGFLHICPFDDRPGKLFEGLQNCRSVIFVSRGRPQDGNLLFTSKYQRWSSDIRDILFPQLRHTLVRDQRLYPDLFPKFACRTAQSVFQKVAKKSKNVVGMALVHHVTDDFIFYQEATRYWIKAAVGLPYYAKNGHVGAPAHGRYLYFDSPDSLYPVFGLLNSSLFYIYFIVFGDCFHLSDGLVSGFPIPPDLCQQKALSKLSRQLAKDLHVNAEKKSIETKDGDKISYEEFYGSRSKVIIDEIDFALSEIYGLSAEETDFVCNYDIKFRMGNSLEETED